MPSPLQPPPPARRIEDTERCSCRHGEACDVCQDWESAADYDPHGVDETAAPVVLGLAWAPPRCAAFLFWAPLHKDGTFPRCDYYGRYDRDGHLVCGRHLRTVDLWLSPPYPTPNGAKEAP